MSDITPPARPASLELPPTALVLFLFLLTVIRWGVAASADLTEDEAYYWLWSLAPSHGYLDHAPAVAWVIAAGTALFGDTALGVRAFGPIAILIGSIALWRTAHLLFGSQVAALTVLWFNAMLLVAAGTVIMTPDTPAVLAWGLALWALAELRASGNSKWWLAVGVFAGLGLLSKYSVLFLGAGLVVWLLVTAEGRPWLKRWELWVGGLIAITLFVPVLEWNRTYEWASFLKQFGRGARSGGLDLRFLPEFFGAFVALSTPLILAFGVWGVVRGLRQRHTGSLLLIATSAPFLIYLIWHGLFARVQPNWPAPLLPAFAILAASATLGIGELGGKARAVLAVCARFAAPLGFVLSALLYLHAVMPFVTLEGRRDRTNQMRGWQSFAADVAAVAEANQARYVATTSYGTTASLAWALRDNPGLPVVQINERVRYVHLQPPDPTLFEGNGLYVELARRDLSQAIDERFSDLETMEPLTRTFRGVGIAVYGFHRLGPAVDWPLGPIEGRPEWP